MVLFTEDGTAGNARCALSCSTDGRLSWLVRGNGAAPDLQLGASSIIQRSLGQEIRAQGNCALLTDYESTGTDDDLIQRLLISTCEFLTTKWDKRLLIALIEPHEINLLSVFLGAGMLLKEINVDAFKKRDYFVLLGNTRSLQQSASMVIREASRGTRHEDENATWNAMKDLKPLVAVELEQRPDSTGELYNSSSIRLICHGLNLGYEGIRLIRSPSGASTHLLMALRG